MQRTDRSDLSFIYLNTRLGGGEGEEVCLTESAMKRFRSRIKEMNHTKNGSKRFHRLILAYVVMADGFVCGGSL